ncbi:NACHT, LRR and PYD domains-containing protein 1b allele 5-like [Carassius auratus]|uniref:NACHT, LRR and PYD domains-containing protein 1b allele 5-like n=1 Tax=Carassius auratus TaxID=7957 RepID=A0A6P6KHM2_CARAU|nr:NACHT, LRR and PYD domains-containing protein 1b allele 5-like [Carassius auratus]
MSRAKNSETVNENRPPVTYLVALNDKLQMNADKLEKNIIETKNLLNRDIKRINEGRKPLYQQDIDRSIPNLLEQLIPLDKDAAEASRLQHPHSEMIEKDIKQLRQRVTSLREEHDRIYHFAESRKLPTLDDTDWDVKIPSEDTSHSNTKYSVSSSDGQHECSETGLRWRSDTDVSLEYRFVDWKSLSKDVLKNYKPCGPLMDITVTSGSLEEVQLPHFVSVDSESSSDDVVKALHVKDDGTVSLERCELSGFHAKLVNPTFSFLAIVVEVQQFLTMKFHCETLIYRNRTSPLNLHVYLILKDKKLKKKVEEKEKHNMEILKPTPDEALKIDESFTLKASSGCKIKPSSLKLTPNKTNFFDLHIQDPNEPIEISMMTKDGQNVWEVYLESDEFNIDSSASQWRQGSSSTISKSSFIMQWMRRLIEAMGQSAIARLEAPHMPSTSEMKKLRINRKDQERGAGLKGAEFVEKHRTELIRKVSLVAPIADDMKDLIGDEKYQIIFNSVTPQDRMRKLLEFITTTKLREKLYQSLLKHERFLVDELQHCE